MSFEWRRPDGLVGCCGLVAAEDVAPRCRHLTEVEASDLEYAPSICNTLKTLWLGYVLFSYLFISGVKKIMTDEKCIGMSVGAIVVGDDDDNKRLMHAYVVVELQSIFGCFRPNEFYLFFLQLCDNMFVLTRTAILLKTTRYLPCALASQISLAFESGGEGTFQMISL